MEFVYDDIVQFIRDYFITFTAYAQDPATTDRLHDFYAPDFEIVHYTAAVNDISGRDNFLRLLSAHPSSHETLTPEDIAVDERRKIAAVLVRAEITDRKTGEVLVVKRYLCEYRLIVDESNTLKIKKIVFFEEVLPPGTLDVGDVYMKDPEMADLFSSSGKEE
jgi:hypothetical protein